MKVSKSTFYRDIDVLLKDGAVKKTSEGYSISTELFPVFDSKEKEMIRELKSYLDESAKNDGEFKNTRLYRTFYYYYNKGFEGLDMPISDFITQLTSGFFFKKKPDTDSNKKERAKQTYSF